MAGNVLILNPFEQTFGMPPASHVSDAEIVNSMPVMEITPCIPHFEAGLTLFSLNTAWSKYNQILNNLGFKLSSEQIKLAFIADNFPTDTFTNNYGESFLQKFTDVASQGMQQIAQMTGAESGIQGIEKLGTSFQNIGKGMGGALGGIVESGGAGAYQIGEALGKLQQNISSQSQFMRGSLNTINKLVAGHRVDFPQIWTNSAFSPSYTATIRLYNPNPGSRTSTSLHIIGPLAVLLCLAIPRTDDGKTFNWPFFHKIVSKGIYNLSPAVITNITVVKGGDQQQISFNQKLGMVDVRLEFTSLYNTMLLEENKQVEVDRPTVRNYLENLQHDDSTLSNNREDLRTKAAASAGVSNVHVTKGTSSIRIRGVDEPASKQLSLADTLAKNEAALRKKAQTVEEQTLGSRVDPNVALRQNNLSDETSPDFIPPGI
jgi:hypothetical protein